MTASQDELTKWYDQLLEEVLELADQVGKGRTKAGGIPLSTAKLIRNLIEKNTGQVNFITAKTIGNYYRDGYSASRILIGLFAAVSLIRVYKGELSIEDCHNHYGVNKPSSTEYWNLYINTVRNRVAPEPAPEYAPESAQWESQDVTKDVLNVFPSPDYHGVYERTEEIEKLYDKICRHRLLVVDGIAGCGKKHLIKAIEPKLLRSAKYNRIWWVPLHKKYTLTNFFDELPFEMDSSIKGNVGKLQWFEEQLKSNRILIIFYEIDQAESDSFLPLIQRAFDKPGDCRYLVLRDVMSLFPEIPPINKFTVPPYTDDEIKALFELKNIQLSKENISSITEISGRWPYYLNCLLQHSKDHQSLEKILNTPGFLNEDLSRWFRLWSSSLNDNDHKLMQIIFLYNVPISEEDLIIIAKEVGLQQPNVQIETLRNVHFLVKGQIGSLLLTPPGKQYASAIPDNGSAVIIHGAITTVIRKRLPLEPSFDFSSNEFDDWQKVIEHYQQAGMFDQSGPLIDKIKRSLKRRIKYPLLISLLNKQIGKEPQNRNWFQFDLAHAYFVTGDYEKCILALSPCLKIAIEWYPQNKRDADGIAFFLKTIQLFVELCSSAGLDKQAISIFFNALSLFDYTEMNWTNRCHTITVLSQFYERNKKPETSLRMNENLLEGNYGHDAIGRAVIAMRMAFAQRKLSQHKDAHHNLLFAKRLFISCKDNRGLAWSLSILALDHLDHGNLAEAKKMIKQVIHVHVEGSLANEDYRRWLTYLLYKNQLKDFHPMIESELERTSKTEVHSGQPWLSTLNQKIDEISRWLQQRAKPFDMNSFIKPLRGKDIPLNTILIESLEQRIRRKPISYLEKIAAMQPEVIFGDSHITHQVGRCATSFESQEFIKREIISRNFEFLCDPDKIQDDIRIQYASILYTMGEYQLALNLLDYVVRNQSFDFIMLKADCLTRCKQFIKADNIYASTIEIVGNNRDRAMILYKHSTLVIEGNATGRFEEALAWSIEALELRYTEEDFVHHAENTIVYLTIELTPLERLELEVQRMKTIYTLSPSRLESIVPSISNITKRNMLKRIILS